MNKEFGEREAIQDHCGILASYATGDVRFFQTGLAGLRKLQTRGYDGAGVCAVNTEGNYVHHKAEGMVDTAFPDSVIEEMQQIAAKLWMYQIRYGTNGGFIPENVQPIIGIHKESEDPFFVSHNGEFLYGDDGGVSDTVRFTRELEVATDATWGERIASLLSEKRGAWSLAVGTKEGLFLARDPYGIRPLAYGSYVDDQTGHTVWVAASETSALEKMGLASYTEVLPGQVIKIDDRGPQGILPFDSSQERANCSFETIYIQDGATRVHAPRENDQLINEAITVEHARKISGKILAHEAPLTRSEVDVVIGVPGTGIAGGEAYAETLGLPYKQFIADRDKQKDQRTFMLAQLDIILQKVLDHFEFNAEGLRGKRVVLVDDSIVRGNIMTGLIRLLKEQYGVVEVHVRVLSPPIDKGCYLGVNTRREDLLIARQENNDVEKIRERIGADTLAYLSSEGLVEAIGGDKQAEGFCLGCMVDHQPPINRNGTVIFLREEERV